MNNKVTFLQPANWIEENIRISHPKLGLVPFKLHTFQRKVITAIEDEPFVIVNKFRQGGISTTKIAYALWEALHHLDQNIVFLSRTDREARELNRMMRNMIDQLPDQFGEPVKPSICNDHHIRFDDVNSEVHFWKAEARKAKRITHLYIDEAAFIPGMDDYWKCIYPCLSRGSKCTVSSTPNMASGWFWKTFDHALQKKNRFFPIRLHYKDHPEYNNLEFERKMMTALGPKGFIQEMTGCFLLPPEEEQTHFQTSWDELERKEKQIQQMIVEYGKIVAKIEDRIGQAIYQEIDGKPMVLTNEEIERKVNDVR